MENVIGRVARKIGVPKWWAETVAIEYLNCRDYLEEGKIWVFNWDKIEDIELEEALSSFHVIVRGMLFHNVRENVLVTRMLERLGSDIPCGLSEEIEDYVPEGLASKYCVFFSANDLSLSDPKLGFSRYFQVYENEQLWQWKIADLVNLSDEKRSKWISQEIDIEPINKISLKYAELSKKIKKLDDNSKKQLYKEEIAQFYEWVDRARRPILLELYDLHKRKRNTKKIHPKTTYLEPPIISKFEKFKIDKGEFFTKFFAEPIFFRECCQQSKEALELLQLVKNEDDFISKLDEIYQKRAVVVILAAACIEAFINSLGYERFPDLWKGIEKLDIENKLRLYLALNGKPSLYDSCREPYQSLKKIKDRRNLLMHFKGKYEEVKRDTKDKPITQFETILDEDFVNNLPLKIEDLVKEVCNETNQVIPSWLKLK